MDSDARKHLQTIQEKNKKTLTRELYYQELKSKTKR